MSVETARAFMETIRGNGELQRKLDPADKSEQEVVALFVQHGAEAGYSFTPADCKSAFEQLAGEERDDDDDGELSDADLAAVAGGRGYWWNVAGRIWARLGGTSSDGGTADDAPGFRA